MTDVALSLQNVDKIYQRRGKPSVHAVKALQMDVNKGEIVALLGSSGCGKTSTLRMIAGFEDVTSGSIQLAGRRIDKLSPAQRGVTMAFEGYSLYPPLTVRDNIAFALKSSLLPPKEVQRAVEEIARLVEIDTILDRYPSSISGGQQQRASLARALVRNADLYLLDEPMGQLEPQLRALLRGRLKSLLIERGMTSIFVTHDQTEANALADRIAVMEGGVLQQFANPKELRERPANLFVATFVGEPPMNVFEASVVNADTISFAVEDGPNSGLRELGSAAERQSRDRQAGQGHHWCPAAWRAARLRREQGAGGFEPVARRPEPFGDRRRRPADGRGHPLADCGEGRRHRRLSRRRGGPAFIRRSVRRCDLARLGARPMKRPARISR